MPHGYTKTHLKGIIQCTSISSHLVIYMLSLPSQGAPVSAPSASKTTNTSRRVLPSSNNASTSLHVPPVPTITARPEQERSVDLSSVSPSFRYCPKLGNICVPFQDSDTETDFTASVSISILVYFLLLSLFEIQDLCDDQYPNKKQKHGTQTGKHNSEPFSQLNAH